MTRVLVLLIWSVFSAQVIAGPPEALALALGHARLAPLTSGQEIRYLDLTHYTPAERDQAYRVLCFHLNALSRESDIVLPFRIDGGAVIGFDLRDYGIDKGVYGRLGGPEAADPYFHAVVENTDQYGKKTRDTVHAPWLPPAQIAELANLCGSRVPILRADWFFFQTAVQKDRQAGYYDMLGLGKKSTDFQKLIGANPSEAKRLKLEMAASVASSSVALHNRGIFRQQSLTGGHWTTLDFKTSTNKQNTARLLAGDTEPPQGDASEQFGVLPNGLFAYWLENAKGERQDTAPDDIASDGRSTSNDRRVHAMLSCVRCHVEGLRPVDDYARRLFRGPLQLVSPDYDKLKRLRQLYLSDLPGKLGEDNGRYAAALKAINSWTAAENANNYAAFWESYADTPVAPARAARELGITEERLLQAVREYVRTNQIADPVIASFAQDPPVAIRRDHLEEVYPELQRMIGGFK